MAKSIFVGSLPYTTTEEELTALFSEAGEVSSVRLINDRETGRSKGIAFVEMASDEAFDKAVETLNGREFGGRTLVVNEARPKEDRPAFGGGNRGGSGSFGGGSRGGNGGGFGGGAGRSGGSRY